MALFRPAQGGVVNASDPDQFYDLLTGAMTDQPVTIANRVRAQLAGAVTASGYVGGTAGGPPVTGTFAAGDMVIDTLYNGVWICTAAGTPGTWRAGSTMALSSQTLGVAAASVTFPSIPGGFGSLMLVGLGSVTGAGAYVDCPLAVNGDAGANYASLSIDASQAGLTPSSSYATGGTSANWALSLPGTTLNALRVGAWSMVIPGYSNTTMRKAGTATSWITDGGSSWSYKQRAWYWSSVAAITSLAFTSGAGNFSTGSYFALYGMP